MVITIGPSAVQLWLSLCTRLRFVGCFWTAVLPFVLNGLALCWLPLQCTPAFHPCQVAARCSLLFRYSSACRPSGLFSSIALPSAKVVCESLGLNRVQAVETII